MTQRRVPASLLILATALPYGALTAQDQPPTVDRARNQASVPALPARGTNLPAAPTQGQAIQSRHFSLAGDIARLAIPEDELAARFDGAFEYVRERIGLAADAVAASARPKIQVWILPPGAAGRALGCPQRGAIMGDLITIYADAATSPVQLMGVLAHEIGHLLMFRQLAGGYRSSGLMLPEGYATWAAGRYMTDWYGVDSLQETVAGQVAQGTYLAITEPVGDYYSPPTAAPAGSLSDDECFARRDHVYAQWGGFVEFLIDREGHDSFLALLQPGSDPGPPQMRMVRVPDRQGTDQARISMAMTPDQPPYEDVYGSSLEELQTIWLATIEAAIEMEAAD